MDPITAIFAVFCFMLVFCVVAGSTRPNHRNGDGGSDNCS
jgi:hypothetical protein